MRTNERIAPLAGLLVLGLAAAVWAEAPNRETSRLARPGDVVRTPRLISEHVVDCHSVESIIGSIIRPGMTQREKAEAIYDFVRAYRFHWAPAREGDLPSDFTYGIVYDPVKLISVYGYGYCFQCAPLLESLYQAAGLEARGCGISGHSIAEVFYDGAYHFYDADQQGYCLLPDGKTVASMDQLSRDPVRLVLNQPNPSRPYFPATANPLVPYESKVLGAAYFASRANNYTRHDKVDQGHRMDVSLAPGMRYVRHFQPKGKWNYRHKELASDCANGYLDPNVGPKDHLSEKRYGNGELLWQPDLRRATGEYRAGVWADHNIAQDERGLRPAKAGEPAWAVFRVRLPYVIVGWPTAWTGPAKPVGAAVVSAGFVRAGPDDAQAISVSTDHGRTWKRVWRSEKPGPASAVADFSELVVPEYEYLLRVELSAKDRPGDSRLERLAVRTSFQLNPLTLPAVRAGKTRMSFRLGEETETFELMANLSTREGLLREADAVRGVWFAPKELKGKFGRQGEVVYRFEPPRPGEIRSVQAVAGCRREPGQLHHLDDVKIYFAEGEAKGWKLLADDDVPPYTMHWSYYVHGGAGCSAGTRRVFVKFAVRTEAHASLKRLRLRVRWRPDGEAGVPRRGVRIEHGWTEGEAERTFRTTVARAPTDYVVEAGQGVVNRWVAMEPVREEGCKWRPNDPPVQRPRVPAAKLVDPAVREEMRSLLRAIDGDPGKGLAKGAASGISWLADGARQAQAMFRARYPLPDASGFGRTTLAAAGGLAGLKRALTAADAERLLAVLSASRDDRARASLAAALLLLNDNRGRAPLAGAVQNLPAVLVVEPAVVLLRTGDAVGRQVAAEILAGPDTYLKLNFLEKVAAAKVQPVPDELLAALTDASRWVRLAVLEMLRGSTSPAARRAVLKMSAEDPLEFLRAEAASVLASMSKGKN